MSARFFWEAVRADGSIARGFATSPEEAGLHRMPDDLDFLCVIHRPSEVQSEADDDGRLPGRLDRSDGTVARHAGNRRLEADRQVPDRDDATENEDGDPVPERPILSWFERPIRRPDRD